MNTQANSYQPAGGHGQPGTTPDATSDKNCQSQNRSILSSFFVTLLIGLAFQEMVSPVRESIRASGLTFGTLALMAVFFVTSLRFFIGNMLHLLSDSLTRMPGLLWFYDLMIIIAQSIILIFIGGFSSSEANINTPIDFVTLLIALYAVDVVWVCSQWGFGKIFPSWKREFIPWAWAVLNLILIVTILLTKTACGDLYSGMGLAVLLALSTLAGVVDMILVDYYKVL